MNLNFLFTMLIIGHRLNMVNMNTITPAINDPIKLEHSSPIIPSPFKTNIG